MAKKNDSIFVYCPGGKRGQCREGKVFNKNHITDICSYLCPRHRDNTRLDFGCSCGHVHVEGVCVDSIAKNLGVSLL